MTPLLQLRNVVAGYRSGAKVTPVMRADDVALSEGSVVSLLGANGAGKSTLLRSIDGSLPLLSGEILLAGKPLGEYSRRELARLISIVSTDRTNAGGLTVYEFVALGRQPYTGFLGRLDATDRSVIQEAMASVGIAAKSNAFVAELSDGERQKTMIARALAQQTPVILLDEPTSFLDVTSRIDIMQLLHLLSRRRRKAVLLSSHDVALSLALSDELWLLSRDGALEGGATEDMVLAGKVNSVFDGRSASFDLLTGNFSPSSECRKSVALICEDDVLRHWITNALARNGFSVAHHARYALEARSSTSIFFNGAEHASVADAMAAVAEINI